MDGCQMNDVSAGKDIAFPKQEYHGPAIRLIFSEEPNQEAPILIRELLRKSYFDHLSSESEREP